MANEALIQASRWNEAIDPASNSSTDDAHIAIEHVTGNQISDRPYNIRLTKRESEVLGLVVEGKSNKEVANQLFCSKRTVDFHLARIYEKLQVNNRIQAVRRAANLGLLMSQKYID